MSPAAAIRGSTCAGGSTCVLHPRYGTLSRLSSIGLVEARIGISDSVRPPLRAFFSFFAATYVSHFCVCRLRALLLPN